MIYEFIDKKNHKIEINIDELKGAIHAYYSGKCIAKVCYDTYSNDNPEYILESMKVDNYFQNLGIGKEMIRLGHEHFNVTYFFDSSLNLIPGNCVTKKDYDLFNCVIEEIKCE